ncbi:MAG: type II toxin-antitoxin system RelE/ParE family toxin [Candidatus Pacebacteria bacterium]|nr:type II toxin-antitoxin system RelE/ParE family toxin [Candidatus Paceibacterota bacterium]
MEIRFFEKSVEKFIKSLEKQTIAKTIRTIELLGVFGSEIRMPYSKKIDNDIFELRIRGAQEVRIIYTFHKKQIILLHGFVKKDRKIPRKEIERAKNIIKLLD